MRSLGFYVDRIKRLAGGHEESIPLGATEADIATDLGQENLTDPISIGREDVDPIVALAHPAGAGPDVAVDIRPNAIRETRLSPEFHRGVLCIYDT